MKSVSIGWDARVRRCRGRPLLRSNFQESKLFLVNVGAVAAITFPVFVAVIVLRWRRSRRWPMRRWLFETAMYAYLLLAAHYTLLPLAGPAFAAQYRAEARFLVNSNFVPLDGATLASRGTIGNILLMVPWGFLVAALWRERHGVRAFAGNVLRVRLPRRGAATGARRGRCSPVPISGCERRNLQRPWRSHGVRLVHNHERAVPPGVRRRHSERCSRRCEVLPSAGEALC